MKNTLISPRFPYKLLALRLFTLKGDRAHQPDSVFVGLKDATTQLFFSQETSQHALLARSYGTDKSDLDLLCQDLGRQYGLAVPKEIPACTSCIMRKCHVHPHLSTGFERASRIAEGFHSDFRGPFSVATPQGSLYLLTIIDDYSRRIFGFLAKSQSV
jgi:hypothetical protein